MLSAQVRPYNPVVEGMRNGARIAEQTRQAQLAEQAARTLQAQEDQIRLQNEQMRREAYAQPPAPGPSPEIAGALIAQAIDTVRKRHPDFSDFSKEMVRLQKGIESDQLPIEEYIEGLYAMAKYSPLSRAPKAASLILAEKLKAASVGAGK
jgi:hypothetical protein